MLYVVEPVQEKDFAELTDVWEASVRATHNFLREEDIQFFRPLILNEYLFAVNLLCIRDADKRILGFLGERDKKIEMLFIHPTARGKGIGRRLTEHAVHTLMAHKVDVNEQNEQAVGFYKHLGFKTIKRSALDSLGKPYPVLHMELSL